MTVTPVTAGPPQAVPLSFCSKLSQLAEIVAQTAIRVLFVAVSILMTASVLPVSFHAVAIPIVGLGTALLAGFFFQKIRPISTPLLEPPPPLVRAIVSQGPIVASGALPADAPRGLSNLHNNCGFNSLVHFLESDPRVAHWLRHPMPQNIDMAGFQNFMAGYQPTPRLMNDFVTYAAAQNPQRPVPAMFADFLNNYIPPLDEMRSFRNIQDVYRNINLLHETYSHFLGGYDQAVRESRSTLGGTQELRLAINRITPTISHSEARQEDAPEILTQILNVLPDVHRVKIEQATHYEVGGHPIAGLPDATSRKPDRVGAFTLELPKDQPTAQLTQMFQRYCDSDIVHPSDYKVETNGVQQMGADRQIRRYKPDHSTVRILDAPTALRFQIKRFYNEAVPTQWYNRWLGVPKTAPRLLKLDTPVEAPEEMTITLANGERKVYRLASFINQEGDSIERGHYTACRIVNGQKYLMSDTRVTLEDQQSWDEKLRKAYLLCYLPVP